MALHIILFQPFAYQELIYNTSFRNTKQPRKYDVLHKVKRPTVYKT